MSKSSRGKSQKFAIITWWEQIDKYHLHTCMPMQIDEFHLHTFHTWSTVQLGQSLIWFQTKQESIIAPTSNALIKLRNGSIEMPRGLNWLSATES